MPQRRHLPERPEANVDGDDHADGGDGVGDFFVHAQFGHWGLVGGSPLVEEEGGAEDEGGGGC